VIGKRRLGLFAGIVASGILLSACGGPASPSPIGKQAETITLGMQQEPDTLFRGIGSMMARTIVLGGLDSPLVRENDKPEFIAWGAESKPTIQNKGATFVGTGTDKHLEVTFKIRPQKWHDGQAVTAADARFGWENLFLNPKFPANSRDAAEKLWDLTVVDSKTLVAKFMSEAQALQAAKGQHPIMKDPKEFTDYKDWAGKGPVVDPLYFLFGDWLYPKHILSSLKPEEMAKSDFANKPVYNGPYKFKEWIKGQTITLTANPDYFQGAPKIKNMVFKFVKDASVMIAALRAGELDVATQIGLDLDNKPELDPLQDRFTISYIPGTKWEHIDFNLRSGQPTADPHVRKAVAYAINRKAIVDNLLFGKSQIANAFIPDWHPYYKPNSSKVVTYKYDPAMAEKELKDAGYVKGADGVYAKDGKKLTLKFQTTDATLRKLTGELIRKDLEKVGIKPDVEYLIARTFFAGAGKGPLSNGTFQLGMYTWLSAFDPDSEGLYLGSHTPTQQNGYSGQNFPAYSGADSLIQKADLTAEIVVNEPERIKVYGDILRQWTTDLPVLPLFLRVSPMVARKELKNWRPTKTSAPETWNCFEWELPAKS